MKRPDLMLILTLLACAGVLASTAYRAGADADETDQAKTAGVEVVYPKAQYNPQAMKIGDLVRAERQQRVRR